MKSFFIFFIFFNLYIVSASLDLSDGKLVFDFDSELRECKFLTISSKDYSGDIQIRDVWTENREETNINNYNLTLNELGGSISYDKKTINFSDEERIEICIQNNNLKNDIRGAIILTPSSDTNIVVESGVWILFNIAEKELSDIVSDEKSDGEKSISGGGSNKIENKNIESSLEKNNEESKNKTNNIKKGTNTLITGAIIGDGGEYNFKFVFVGIIILVIVTVFLIYKRRY